MDGTILIVDDSRSVRQYCKSELEAEGYFVLLSHDAEEAILVISQIMPDVVVTDVHMRPCSGIELVRRVKAVHPDLPVVFYTSDDENRYVGSADAVVKKSENLVELKRAIRECLSVAAMESHAAE